MQDFDIGDDGRTVTFPVELEANRRYGLIVSFAESEDDRVLIDPFTVRFNTLVEDGEIQAAGAVAGTVVAPEGVILDDAEVFLYDDSAGRIARAGVATVGDDGTYLIEDVLPGRYQAYAEATTSDGEELFQFYDLEGDGEASPIDVVADLTTSGIDITLSLFVEDETASAVADTADTNRVVSLDLNEDTGNDRRSALSGVSAGSEVLLAVYVQDVAEITGFAVELKYDPQQMEFIGVTETTATETNFLANGGSAPVFLPPLLGTETIKFGAALLSPTSATAAAGSGPLGFFRFATLPGFSGTVFGVTNTVLKGLTSRDTLSIPVRAVLTPPLEDIQQVKGPVSFDFDVTDGDQGQLNRGSTPAATEFDVAVYLNGITDTTGVTDLTNYSVVVQYEPENVTYIGFAEGTAAAPNFLGTEGGTILPLPPILGANSIEFGNAILGPTAANSPDGKGLIGVLTFQASDPFDQSDLIITEYSAKLVGGAQQTFSTVLVGRIAEGEVDLSIPVGEITEQQQGTVDSEADFSGDGVVDFTDFFQFADAFGQPAEGFEAMDLNGDGFVDFSDFFAFADAFGQSAKRAALPEFGGEVALDIDVGTAGAVTVNPAIDLATPWDRWGLALRFDAAGLEWTGAGEDVLAIEIEPGHVLLSGAGDLPPLRLSQVPGSPGRHIEAEVRVERAAVRLVETGQTLALEPTGASALRRQHSTCTGATRTRSTRPRRSATNCRWPHPYDWRSMTPWVRRFARW